MRDMTGTSTKTHGKGKKIVKGLTDNWFMITTIIGVAIGFGVGFALQKADLNTQAKLWLDMPGKLYIRILQLTILPIITANIITVIATLNPKENGKVSGVTIAYILACNLVCTLIGLAYVYIIRPGATRDVPRELSEPAANDNIKISYIFRDLLLNIFPDNLVNLTLSQSATDFDHPRRNEHNETYYTSVPVSGTNMIGVLFCSVAFGMATNAAKEKGVAFREFFTSLGEVVMILMQKFLLITPVCVMFMVMSSISNVDNLTETFKSLGFFIVLNIVSCITHLLILLLSLVCLCKNPFRILSLCLPPYFIGFATTSALVSLPKCYDASDSYGIPKSISRFVLPIAGTMKSDASASFIIAAVFYVAQTSGVHLDIGKVLIVIILTTAYVSALPNIPSASVIAAITILNSIGLNSEIISILYAVEWLNDRLRSGNIVLSHMYCTAFVYHVCVKDVDGEMDEEEEIQAKTGTEVDLKIDTTIV